MARVLIFVAGALVALLGFIVYQSNSSRKPAVEPRKASSRLARISPSAGREKVKVKPYLMLHIEDLKKCFPRLLSDARPETLLTLDDVMVEVEKVFLPAKRDKLFHQLRFRNQLGEEMVLRATSGRNKKPELFYINDKKEWIQQVLDPDYETWPMKALFRHFSAENEVIEEEEHFFRRGRSGEHIGYKVRGEQVTELNLYSPLRARRLTCNLREPKAILCICDLTAGAD